MDPCVWRDHSTPLHSTWLELAQDKPPTSRELVARQGGGSVARGRVWPYHGAAGAEQPLQYHWERAQGQAGTCTGLGRGATSKGAGGLWSSGWSSREQHQAKLAHPLGRQTSQFDVLHGHVPFWSRFFFFCLFSLKLFHFFFFSVPNFSNSQNDKACLRAQCGNARDAKGQASLVIYA